jgi:hypothetical protein
MLPSPSVASSRFQPFEGVVRPPAPGLSRPWLVQARLDSPFTQVIATAMPLLGASLRLARAGLARKIAPGDFFAPGPRPGAPVLRQHPGCWRNRRATVRPERRERFGASAASPKGQAQGRVEESWCLTPLRPRIRHPSETSLQRLSAPPRRSCDAGGALDCRQICPDCC